MTPIALSVNGRKVQAMIEPRTHLADFLREHCRLTGTHLGCEHGVCGACTIVWNGELIRSCLVFAVQANGAELRTMSQRWYTGESTIRNVPPGRSTRRISPSVRR